MQYPAGLGRISSQTSISHFRFPLSPFAPETPDTQAKIWQKPQLAQQPFIPNGESIPTAK